MKSRSRSHTPIDVDTDPFSFDQMRNQLDGIQQVNSNYEEISLHVLNHTPQHKVLKKKCEESSDSKPKSRHAEIQNLWATYFKNNINEKDLIKNFPALLLKKKLLTIILNSWEQKE